jgi:hypothetical protein
MGQHYWMMSPAEQAALVFLLEHLRPKVARAGLSFALVDGDHSAEG